MKHKNIAHHGLSGKRHNLVIPASMQLIFVIGGSYFVNFLLNSVLSNNLSTHNYGEYSLILQFSLLLSTVILLGLDSNFIHFGSDYTQNKTPHHTHGLLKWTEKKIKTAALICVGITALLCLCLFFHNKIYNSYEPVYISFIIIPFYAYLTLQMAYLQAFGYDLKAMAPTFVAFPTFFIAVFYLMHIFTKGHLTIYHAIAAMALSYLSSCIIAYLFSKKVFSEQIYTVDPSTEHLSDWKNKSAAYWSSEVVFIFAISFEIIVLKLFFDSTVIARVMVVLTIGGIIWTIQNVLSKHLMTFIPSALNGIADSMKKYKTECKKCNRSIILSGVLIFLVVFFFGKQILGVFGTQYVDLVNTLYLYVIMATADAYLETALTTLSLSNDQRKYKLLLVFTIVLGTVLIILFTSLLGAMGTILGYYIAASLSSLLSALIVKKSYNLSPLVL